MENPRGRAEIQYKGRIYKGEVISRSRFENYEDPTNPAWYIEIKEDDRGYMYWKSDIDGGVLIALYDVDGNLTAGQKFDDQQNTPEPEPEYEPYQTDDCLDYLNIDPSVAEYARRCGLHGISTGGGFDFVCVAGNPNITMAECMGGMSPKNLDEPTSVAIFIDDEWVTGSEFHFPNAIKAMQFMRQLNGIKHTSFGGK